MGLLKTETFICLDCEATGLDTSKDSIIEIAAVKFNFEKNLDHYESLVNPECLIPEDSIKIHHITNEMVSSAPKMEAVLSQFLDFIKGHIIVGHGIGFDIEMLVQAAKKHLIPNQLQNQKSIDTLRLARLYGQTSVNSLEKLREHFNIISEGAHRAMNDVIVNIEVFKHLSKDFKTTEALFERLSKPIPMKTMPLGKYKGRLFKEIPTEYLAWASHQQFDQDLLFSLRSELKKRKKTHSFNQAANPFSSL